MGATILGDAIEKSTFVITVAFTDSNGVAVIPNQVLWTLTNQNGDLVNSREDVSVTPASTVNIVVSGDDLAMEGYGSRRILTILAVYDSEYGENLPLRARAVFNIDDLVAVS
jgi:hypothetical protein